MLSSEPADNAQHLPLPASWHCTGRKDHLAPAGHLTQDTLVTECEDPHFTNDHTELGQALTGSTSLQHAAPVPGLRYQELM